MDAPTARTKHVLDYLVGESRRDMTLSIFQVILYILGVGIMLTVLYLLIRRVLPVTDSVMPLISTQLIPTVHSAEPVITDVIKTIRDKTHNPTQQLSKIIYDIVWTSQYSKGETPKPLTRIGDAVINAEKIFSVGY